MTIRWSYKAQKQQDQTANYIYQEFGEKAVEEFYREIDQIETNLLAFPEMGKIEPLLTHKNRTYRSLVVRRLSKLVYTIESDHIRIHAFWDTRREPKRQTTHLS